ncbi:MAG: succinylglutamate desuccinylase/aspartoacylase family protein [Oscillospiraceae bacterium]|nr:succinylglutamate desuccinylase/aspartoacylase family protein [Oscillospiraceae bacterium]
MKTGEICFGDVRAEAGKKAEGYAPVLDTGYRMPITVINGAHEGPTVLITSGVHGGEYPGIQTAIELSRELDPQKIHGQIVLIHPINLHAFYQRVSYCVPEDGKNINRVFPGKPDGTLAEQIAYVVSEQFQARADYHLDLHGGDLHEQLPSYVYYPNVEDPYVVNRSREIADMLEATFQVKTKNFGGAVGSAGLRHHIPALLIERGGRGLWSREEVEDYKANIRNVLRFLQVCEGEAVRPEKQAITVVDDATLAASRSSAWYPCVSLGDAVKEGQQIGELRDLFGNVLETIRAPFDGLVIYMVVSLAVAEGDPLITIGMI